MCIGCWQRCGSPVINNDKIRDAVKLIEEVYFYNGAGGNLHVQLDDWNIENEFFENYKLFDASICDEQKDAEIKCFNALKLLTLEERASALSLYWGYWE